MSTPRSPERLPGRVRRCVRGATGWVLAAVLFGGQGAGLAAAPAPADERAQLQLQLQQMSERFDREAAGCRDRFLVSDCLDTVNRQRRFALAPIRERLLQIDEAERRRRAAERREVLAGKERIRNDRMAGAAAAAQAASGASAPRDRQRMLPPAAPLAPPANRAMLEAERQQAAAERVREAQRRRAQATERQARVARRLAEREAKQGPVRPLPAPPSAPSLPSPPAPTAPPAASAAR